MKVISVPLFFAALIPMFVVFSLVWVVTGKYNPMEVTGWYFEWLE